MAGLPAKFADYVLPALIGAGIYYLQTIAVDVRDMSKALAVSIEKIEQHDRRITTIEHNEETRRWAGPRPH